MLAQSPSNIIPPDNSHGVHCCCTRFAPPFFELEAAVCVVVVVGRATDDVSVMCIAEVAFVVPFVVLDTATNVDDALACDVVEGGS